MSFNAAFLSPTQSPAARERQVQQELAEERAHAVRTYYRYANLLVVMAFVLIVIPQMGWDAWFLHVPGAVEHLVGGVASIVTALALLMMINGRAGKGILTLLFAWIILPAWVLAAPAVVHVAGEQAGVIKKEWIKKVGKPTFTR